MDRMLLSSPKPLSRSQRIAKAKGLLELHRWLAKELAGSRRAGSVITTKFFKARLLVNAKVLRLRILGES